MKRRDFFRVIGAVAAAGIVGQVAAEEVAITDSQADIYGLNFNDLYRISRRDPSMYKWHTTRIALERTYGKETTDQLLLGTPYSSR